MFNLPFSIHLTKKVPVDSRFRVENTGSIVTGTSYAGLGPIWVTDENGYYYCDTSESYKPWDSASLNITTKVNYGLGVDDGSIYITGSNFISVPTVIDDEDRLIFVTGSDGAPKAIKFSTFQDQLITTSFEDISGKTDYGLGSKDGEIYITGSNLNTITDSLDDDDKFVFITASNGQPYDISFTNLQDQLISDYNIDGGAY